MPPLTIYFTLIFSLFTGISIAQQNLERITIQTSGHCGECKKSIEKALTFEKGVKEVRFEKESGKVAIVFDNRKTNPLLLRKAISMTGYDADSLSADPKAYSRLRECCKKEGSEMIHH